MEWLYYLLEANLYLLLFYVFYLLFLQRETFYNANRYYLLLSSITAFLFPILQLGFLNSTAQIVDIAVAFPPPVLYTTSDFAQKANETTSESIDYLSFLYPIYLFVCTCFLVKLIFGLSAIIKLWISAKKDRIGAITIIELAKEKSAFSFFNLLFIHPQLASKPTVLKHEMVHIKQKHSLDIVFFEILQVMCWFNPAIYFLKKDVKLLHEYIADELTAHTAIQKHDYAMFLIENSFGVVPAPLTNQIFNQSILKRRINMLNKKRTAGWARLRLLLALPLGGAMLCTSTMAFTKDYGYIDLLPEKSFANIVQEVPKVENITRQTAPKVENVKRDLVKSRPPVAKQSNHSFYPKRDYKISSTKPPMVEKRYIIRNGKPLGNLENIWAVENASKIVYLNSNNAKSKYGDKANFGAVEITGGKLNILKPGAVPPPPPYEDQVKFRSQVVKQNGKNLKTAPPVEPPPPGYRTKKGQVKFPPPVVKPTGEALTAASVEPQPTNQEKLAAFNKVQGFLEEKLKESKNDTERKYIQNQIDFLQQRENLKNAPPVEPPPPGYRTKKDQVKFPPPVVKPIEKKTSSKVIEGDPIKQTEVKEVLILGDPINSKNN